MKRNKSGISLIVLVITIIVMIILAAAVVITLDNSGIINKANEAVDESNLKQVQQLASLIWAEAYLDDNIKNEDITEKYIREELADQGINTDKYDIIVEENGVIVKIDTSNIPEEWKASVRELTVDGVPIPIGFVKSPYEGEGTKNEGLVIYALTETEIANGVTEIPLTETHQQSLENRNQFVWIPVDKNNFKDEFVRDGFGFELTNVVGEYDPEREDNPYWELVLDSENMPSQDTENDNISECVSLTTLAEATALYKSVAKYGGFYIARYEVGYDDNGNKSITMGKYPYEAYWGTSMSNEVLNDGAVSLSRAFYPNIGTTYGVVSTLTYGVQWDRTLIWWEEQDELDGIDNINLENSAKYGVYVMTEIALNEYNIGAKYVRVNTDYGHFETSWNDAIAKNKNDGYILTTGGYKKSNVYNIYDMAGNIWEWTMEGAGRYERVLRGDSGKSAYRW